MKDDSPEKDVAMSRDPSAGADETGQHDESRRRNRLAGQTSPYLLQHAGNPVDWYPWGDEAFERAGRENKPVFLSIGYSTCHWCHVMERESFEDDEVAEFLNRHFVAVKVDREERPDIDRIYMAVCQATTGSGGWPLTCMLTPDRRPFFAGTYFPKRTRRGRIGLMELLSRVASLWSEQRDEVEKSAVRTTDLIRRLGESAAGPALGASVVTAAAGLLSGSYDARHGGFGTAPKFPTPHHIRFLLRQAVRDGDPNGIRMVEKTLEEMRKGGIFDHLGFGFHRYSTDAEWRVPHFEKMLYDQALIARAYLEAHQATGRPGFACTAGEIFDYVLRDLTSPEGGFYSAEDADSEGIEGKFYTWQASEIDAILGEEDGRLFCAAYQVRDAGNFPDEATGRPSGANILFLDEWPPPAMAAEKGARERDRTERLEAARKKLLAAREARVRPLCDDKILTDWNGLMMSALAAGYQVLGDPRLLAAAQRAEAFISARLTDASGRLLKSYRDGTTSGAAGVDDYAFVVAGLLDLYEASFDIGCLERALALNRLMLDLFWDEQQGGLFMTPRGGEKLIARMKEIYDGAVPSGNSVAALNLLRLARYRDDAELESRAFRIFEAFSEKVGQYPAGHTELLLALDFALGPSFEVVVAGERDGGGMPDTADMLKALRSTFAPRKVVVFRPAGDGLAAAARLLPFIEEQPAVGGAATAYVCSRHACQAPTTDPSRMAAVLASGMKQPLP